MEESKWIKQISKDNSIQFLLCEHFINPTVNDCVVVGNSSFRLLILQLKKIKEVARYDHPKPITSACITYKDGHPEIAFISASNLYFVNPFINHFQVSDPISLDYKYSSIISNTTLICLYPRDSSLLFYQRSNNFFTNYNLVENSKLWSCSFLNDYLFTVEYQNVFKVKIYQTNNLDMIRNVATFVVNYFIPYKLVSVQAHKSVYLLCESSLIQIKYTEPKKSSSGQISSEFSLNKFPIDIRESDPLLVDAAPCGVRLFVLSAGGLVVRFDGSKFERAGDVAGACCLSSMTLTRFLVVTESCVVRLYDGDMVPLDELTSANCAYASYAGGALVVSSRFAVHSVFYDYGIDVDKCARIDFGKRSPKVSVCSDCAFLLFADRTVAIDADFRDVTPSAVKKCVFERVHANSHNSFFGFTRSAISVFEYGSLTTLDEESILSAHRLNSIVTANNRQLVVYTCIHSTLLRQASKDFESAVSALIFAENVYAALFSGEVVMLDDELVEVKRIRLNFIVFSLVSDGACLLAGTGDGRIASADFGLGEVTLRSQSVGNSTVHLACVGSEVTCMCDNRYFYLGADETKQLPPDFLFFGAFTSPSKFIGILKKSKKSDSNNIIQIHFTDKTLGFRSSVLYEFNQPVTKLCAARRNCEFACCVGRGCLVWSRGAAQYNLPSDESVVSLAEWRANHNGKQVQLWMVCTRRADESRLIIFSQSQSTSKVQPIFKKEFKAPITAFAVSNPSLAFFVSGDVINGISLQTGALTAKAKCPAKVTGVVAIDSSEKHIAALADKNEFAVFAIVTDMELRCVMLVRRPGVFGRIRIVGGCVAVSSRIEPRLFIYEIGQQQQLVREVSFLSPVTSIFAVGGSNALVTCMCGEIFIMCCADGGEISDLEVSKLFSFSSSAFSISD